MVSWSTTWGISHRATLAVATALALLSAVANVDTDRSRIAADESDKPAVARAPEVRLISVPLPITGSVDTNVMQTVDRLLAELSADGPRPILIFEFKSSEGQAGEGSQFERSLALARFLTGEQLSRVRTVAYLPTSLKGHAVLVALACEEIVIHPDAEFGEAGAGEKFIDPTMRQGYSEIAERRRTIPPPVVLGMLEKKSAVYKVKTLDGVRYVSQDELEALQQESAVRSVDRVIADGDMGRFTGRDLRLKYSFASHLAADRGELAAVLQVPASALQTDPSLRGGWKPLRIDLKGPLNSKTIQWVLRNLQDRLSKGEINFICVWIDSPGGSLRDAQRLASFLASLDPATVRTVAFVSEQALADAAIVALACDHIVMRETAKIGGPGTNVIAVEEQTAAHGAIQEIAKAKQINWSLPVAMIDSSLQVFRYTHDRTGEVRYLCAEEVSELKDAAAWKRGGEVSTDQGITGRHAEELKVARYLAGNIDEVRQLYNIAEPFDLVRPNWAHVFIESLASPKIAGLLLFVAWFALMIEFMTPGFTGAGLISGICFLLYFWSQFLHGTAGWLEVLLFVSGVSCVAVEIFVLPGFGIVGISGGLMIVASIVLASQTFVIPRNAYQVEQLPKSLYMVVAAGSGAILSLALMRRYLPQAPVFKRMMLAPPDAAQMEEISRRESLVDFNHLHGKRGITTTPLVPAGKAQFGDELVDVISDGELVPRGAAIYVTEVLGPHIVVRPIESA